MKGNAIRLSVALVALSFLASVSAPPAYASPRWSDWSTPVLLSILNTTAGDGTAAESKDGRELFFSSGRPGTQGEGDIWVSVRASPDAPWEPPTNLGAAVNSEGFEYGPSLSRDGHWLFWNSNRPGGAGGNDLYASYRPHTHENLGPFGWQPAVPLTSLNTPSGEAMPRYFQDDETGRSFLFFNSPRLGSVGSNDIWMAEQQPDGSFGPPSNVTELNSTFADVSPTVSHDGLEIIFHSNRSADGVIRLWSSTRVSTTASWSTPVMLETVATSALGDQFPFLSPDGRTLYFSRLTTTVSWEIYTSTRTKETGKP
jgi:Tol biopolymer transport system component